MQLFGGTRASLLVVTSLLGLGQHGVLAAPAAAASPTVSVAAGYVVGMSTPVTSGTSSTKTAVAYLGIPFAAPPTGSLRFAPPVSPTAWSGPLQATSLPPSCMQQFIGGPEISKNIETVFNNPGHQAPAESEDCLYLNVFTPTGAPIGGHSTNLKPVLFWIYGGNLMFGTGSLNYYNGTSFAAYQDVVVVTFNYRTNMFGFSGSPEIPVGKQNSGFLDQRFALQWVQDNIAKFGGDPNRVTIFGESAGGYSVKQLLANPPDPLPFAGAILESAATTVGTGASYEQVVLQFGCELAVSQLDCLRKVDATAIRNFIGNSSLLFYPNVDNTTMTTDVRPNILSKKFANVPVMMGSNADEGRVFSAIFGLDPGNTTAVETIVDHLFGDDPVLAAQVLAAYTGLLTPPFEAGSQVLTDYIFTCTCSSLATFLAANGYNNTWRYFYNATFPSLQVFYDIGAFHTSEIPQVWGTYDLTNFIGNVTSDQIQLSQYMQSTWANFAKNPAAGPQWPRITADVLGNQMGELGGRKKTGETTINVNDVDYMCPLFDAVLAVQGL